MKKSIIALLFLFLLINLAAAEYIFSVDVEIPTDKREILANEDLIVNTVIRSLGLDGEERIDAKLTYTIVDENNNILDKRESTIALQTSLSVTEIFRMPSNIKPGNYRAVVKVSYQDYSASGSDSFYIIKTGLLGRLENFIDKDPGIFVTILFVMALIIVILFIEILHHKKDRYINKVDIEDILRYRRGKL